VCSAKPTIRRTGPRRLGGGRCATIRTVASGGTVSGTGPVWQPGPTVLGLIVEAG
jgi:hypothetical protein